MNDALIRRLVWEVRVMRVLLVVLAVGGVGVLAQVQPPVNDNPIVTRELTVRRADSRESLVLSAERLAALELRDSDGRVRVRLFMGPKGPSLMVYDERGRSDDIFAAGPRIRPLTQK